jgi:hypothetical protein
MPRLVFEGTVGLYCSLSPPPSTSLFSFPVFSLMPQLIYVCPLIFFLLLHFSDCFPLCLSSFRFSAFFISCHCIYSSSSEPSFFTTFIYVCLFPATGALFFFFFFITPLWLSHARSPHRPLLLLTTLRIAVVVVLDKRDFLSQPTAN